MRNLFFFIVLLFLENTLAYSQDESDLKSTIKNNLIAFPPSAYYENHAIFSDELMPNDIPKIFGVNLRESPENSVLLFYQHLTKGDVAITFTYALDVRGISDIFLEEKDFYYVLKVFLKDGYLCKKTFRDSDGTIEQLPTTNNMLELSVNKSADVRKIKNAFFALQKLQNENDERLKSNTISTFEEAMQLFGQKSEAIITAKSECKKLPLQLPDALVYECEGYKSMYSIGSDEKYLSSIIVFEYPTKLQSALQDVIFKDPSLYFVKKELGSVLLVLKGREGKLYPTDEYYSPRDSIFYLFNNVGLDGDTSYLKCKSKSSLQMICYRKDFSKVIISHSNIVHMVKSNSGIYEIPVEINGVLKIDFIFDSGASDVSISSDIVSTLIKTNTLSNSDFIGTQKYVFADGSTAISKVFNIRELKIGNKVVKNIRASISDSIDAPMLLGQSVLQKFGKFTIDNTNHTILIE